MPGTQATGGQGVATSSGGGTARTVSVAVAAIVIPVLAAAWVILYLFPTRTESLWAWPIGTRMTPITMGAGYLGGVWFFVRVIATPEPHRHRGGFLGITALTSGLGLATLLHWDAFSHDHVSFWAWLFLYLAGPFLFAVLFGALHRATPPSTPDEERLPWWLRVVLVTIGAVQVSVAMAIFAVPSLVVDQWPWPMTPLTVRSIAPFIGFTGVFALWALVDARYSALRIGVEATTIGLGLIAIGALTAIGDFTGPTGGQVVYVGALVGLLGVLLAFLVTDPARSDRRLLQR